MKSWTNISWALVALSLFAVGIAVGVYYNNELTIWFEVLKNRQPVATAPPNIPPPAANQPVLEMTHLDQPLPLIFSETLDEPVIQEHLKAGAVVLPLGTTFGQPGNVVITAHSTGTTSFGPYRFAFSKLAELEHGQTFMIQAADAAYTYRVYADEIVWPHEVDKLPNDDRSTVTLVTCWPLWTNFKRLLVHGELVNVAYN